MLWAESIVDFSEMNQTNKVFILSLIPTDSPLFSTIMLLWCENENKTLKLKRYLSRCGSSVIKR